MIAIFVAIDFLEYLNNYIVKESSERLKWTHKNKEKTIHVIIVATITYNSLESSAHLNSML